jgi:hypothetical protein
MTSTATQNEQGLEKELLTRSDKQHREQFWKELLSGWKIEDQKSGTLSAAAAPNPKKRV